jgi:hypothetical protein
MDMTLDEFERRLRDEGPEGRAYLIGKLMRQAKPDDVFPLERFRDDLLDRVTGTRP